MVMLRISILGFCLLLNVFYASNKAVCLKEGQEAGSAIGNDEPDPAAPDSGSVGMVSRSFHRTPSRQGCTGVAAVPRTPKPKIIPSPQAKVTPGGSGARVKTRRGGSCGMENPSDSLLEFVAAGGEERFEVFGSHIVMRESVLDAIRADYASYQGSISDFCAKLLASYKGFKKHQLELAEISFWNGRLINCLDRVILEMPYRIISRVLCERTNGSYGETISGANKARVLAHAFPYELILKIVTSPRTQVFFVPKQQAYDKNGVPMTDALGNPKTEGSYVEFHYDVTLTAEQSSDSLLKCSLPSLGDCKAVIAFNESRNEHGDIINPGVFDTLFHACFHTTEQQRLTRIPVRVEAVVEPKLAFKILKPLEFRSLLSVFAAD